MGTFRMRGGLVWVAFIAGLFLVVVGLCLGSPYFIAFAVSHISVDGDLDPYTLDQVTDFSLKIIFAGLILPVVAFLAVLLMSFRLSRRWGYLLAGGSLLIVAAFFLWLVDVPPYYAANLRTLGDEVQYAIPAVNLLERGRFVLVMNGVDFSPISPFGFHIVLVPFYWFFGPMVGNGIRAVQAGAALALVATFVLASMAVGKKRAILATILLSANPLFIHYTIRIMQATVCLAFTLCGLLFLFLAWRTKRRSTFWLISALLGLLSGFLCLIAFTSVFVVPVFLLIMIHVLRKRKERVIIPVMIFLLAAWFAVLPLLLYNSAVFGSWLKTGYHVWLWSRPPEGGSQFSVVSLTPRGYDVLFLDCLSRLGWGRAVRPFTARFIDLVGLGRLYNMAIFVLLLLGLWKPRRSKVSHEYKLLFVFIGLFLLLNVPAYSFVSFSSPRYFLPIIPIVMIICADAFITNFTGSQGPLLRLKQVSLCILLAFSMAGTASLIRDKFVKVRPFPYRYEMVRAYERIIDGNAVIISGIDGVYMGHFLADGRDVIWLPVSPSVHFARQGKRLLFPVASQNIPLVRNYLEQGRAVYIDDLREDFYPEDYRKIREAFLLDRILNVDGYSIYKLKERSSDAR